jgi:F420-dependent oxidoreductase-like protein
MRLSFKTAPQHTTWAALRDLWVEADDIDVFDAGWTFDHFYPLHGDTDGPCLEGWTVTTALAAITTRLRLGLMVVGNTYRHPAVLANMAAALDQVSNGRLELGIGAGWHQAEHDAYGIALPPLKERFDRLDEALEVIHLLLTEEVANFDGNHFRLRDARCEPKGVQEPRPPLVIGGKGERRTLRAAARWADQWNYPGGTPEDFARLVGVLHAHCAEVGRDPAEIETSVQVRLTTPAEAVEIAATYREVGADHVVVYLPPPHDPAVLSPLAEALASLKRARR